MPETWVTLGVIFMGFGVLVAGALGIALPEGQRLGALFTLIAGGGVGLIVLGVGALTSEPREPSEFTFFVGSVLGFLTVCATSWIVRRRVTPDS
jgi:Na+/proline symporter